MPTLNELKKMATQLKIKGRSKMNKKELESALGIKSGSRKPAKKKSRKPAKRKSRKPAKKKLKFKMYKTFTLAALIAATSLLHNHKARQQIETSSRPIPSVTDTELDEIQEWMMDNTFAGNSYLNDFMQDISGSRNPIPQIREKYKSLAGDTLLRLNPTEYQIKQGTDNFANIRKGKEDAKNYVNKFCKKKDSRDGEVGWICPDYRHYSTDYS